jgi:ribosomal protein S18 acetylase RimI-like enzyme
VDFTVRPATPDDAEALARSWLRGARELIVMAPERFRLPDTDGLVDFLRSDLERPSEPDVLSLVAELEREVVGSLEARLIAAIASARFQVLDHLSRPRVYVDHLSVEPSYRRRGVATELMAAAERWGVKHGAASVALETCAESPLSVPFYEAAGYRRTSIIFEKRLD